VLHPPAAPGRRHLVLGRAAAGHADAGHGPGHRPRTAGRSRRTCAVQSLRVCHGCAAAGWSTADSALRAEGTRA
jgi:hypothetical protein